MVSFIAHMGIGILFAELILRLRTKDPEERSMKRLRYWSIGLLAGLLPDLDVIPAIILGVHSYTFHHIITHTFLAMAIIAVAYFFFRKKELALPFLAGYYTHLFADYIDNSISPLGPFDSITELGLLPGWGPMPGGGWHSEYWLTPGYENHTLWSVFMNQGWGIPLGIEFLSIYDIILILITFVLLAFWAWMSIKYLVSRLKGTSALHISHLFTLVLKHQQPQDFFFKSFRKNSLPSLAYF